jgi:predicted O-linked N-acetylglucosamine transferase (SPINDLY family)
MAKMSKDQSLALALEHLQAGRMAEAEALCREVMQATPQEPESYRILGILAFQVGKYPLAQAFLEQALRLNPLSVISYDNLSIVHQAMGDYRAAEAAALRALAMVPNSANMLSNLGIALQAQGRVGEAESAYRRAVRVNPQHAQAWNNLGSVLQVRQRLGEAEQACRQALAVNPRFAEAVANLGVVLQAQRRWAEAEAAFRQSLAINANQPETENSLGAVLEARARPQDAEAAYRRALLLRPDYAEASCNLGCVLQAQQRLDEAEQAYRQALAIRPQMVEAEVNLGSLYFTMARPDEAEQACRRALEIDPLSAAAHVNLGAALYWQGRAAESSRAYYRAAELRPSSAMYFSHALFSEQYLPGVTPEHLAGIHADWDRRFGAPRRPAWRPHANDRDPQRRLRLGFVSGDFVRHPVSIFLVRILESLDPGQCEIVCYSNRLLKDRFTARLAATAGLWRDVTGVAHEALAEQIRSDRIDVLFDLGGHTHNNRLETFALKPAPVQITWLGYEGTTGLAAMDYILADPYQIPAGTEEYYCERVLRLPESYACYDPPAEAPEVGPLPAQQAGEVTFASFNNLAKISPQVVGLWAEILRQLPGSRLALKYKGLDREPLARACHALFAAEGIDSQRLLLSGWSTYAHSLGCYRDVDIALDSFPFSGSLTTCDALWMGVPVITCPGATFAGRHSLGHLSKIGLTEMVAADLPDYVCRAVDLARDLPRLAELRAQLRARVLDSPLCDAWRAAEELLRVVRGAWEQWVVAPPLETVAPSPEEPAQPVAPSTPQEVHAQVIASIFEDDLWQ